MKKWEPAISSTLLILILSTGAAAQEAIPSGAADFVRGQRAMRKRDVAEAIRSFEDAIAANPDLILSHYYLGYAHQNRKDWEEAGDSFLDFLQAVDKADPSASRLVYYANRQGGLALARTERSRQAIPLLQDALAIEPDDEDVHFFLGSTFHKHDLNELAEKHLARAIELDAGYSEAYFYMGHVFFDREDLSESKRYFTRFASLDPSSPHVAEAHFMLGQLALKEAEIAQQPSDARARAKASFEMCLSLSPSKSLEERAKKALEQLENPEN